MVNKIREIADKRFADVKADTSESIPSPFGQSSNEDISSRLLPKWESCKLASATLREAINDKNMPAEKKVDVVYKASIELMSNLLLNPTAENISETKGAVSEIVDMVLSQNETSLQMLKIVSHDYYTYTHSVNVGILGILLAKNLFGNSDIHNIRELGAGFFLHDIGKVRINQLVINKPGKLSFEEMAEMKFHASYSYQILKETDQITDECAIIALQHHEREDGSGYPMGLKGDQIHIYGRMCSIADVYDALTSERSYKNKLAPFEALKLMRNEMLNHFHKDIFEKFVLLFSNS